MKKIIMVIAAIGILTIANANESSVKNENFQQIKAEIINHLNKRNNILQEGIACVKAAQSRKELKACRMKSKSEREKIKGEVKRFRKNLKK